MEKKSSMASFFSDEEEYDFLEISSLPEEDENDDLSFSHWEFISASDADFEEPKQEKRHQDHDEEDNGSESFPIEDQIESQVLHLLDDVHDKDNDEDHGHHNDDGGDDDDHDDDYDFDDDAVDLNDELVPWSVSGKFGRQRMRKVGKRGFTKMYNSKRSPYLFVTSGAVRGKHGLGMKHSF